MVSSEQVLDQLLDEFEANESPLKLDENLNRCLNRPAYIKITNRILQRAFSISSRLVLLRYVKLFDYLRRSSVIVVAKHNTVTFDNTIANICYKYPKSRSEMELVTHGFPFLNELYAGGFFQQNFYMKMAKPIVEHEMNEIAVDLLYEIVKNVELMVSTGLMEPLDHGEQLFWNAATHTLEKASQDFTVNKSFQKSSKIHNFLKKIEQRGGFLKEYSMDDVDDSMTLLDAEDRPPIGTNQSSGSSAASYKLHFPEAAPVVNSGKKTKHRKQLPQPRVKPSSGYSKFVVHAIQFPEETTQIAQEIQRVVSELKSKQGFQNAINSLLSEFAYRLPQSFEICPKIFKEMKQYDEQLQHEQAKIKWKLSDAIASYFVNGDMFRSKSDMERFCDFDLKIAEQLFRIGLVPSQMWKTLLKRYLLINNEIATMFTLRILIILDNAIDNGSWKPSFEELHFLNKECNEKLGQGLQSIFMKNVSKAKIRLFQDKINSVLYLFVIFFCLNVFFSSRKVVGLEI